MAPSLYLAGPEVFLPDAADIGAAKKALAQRHGFVGLFPADEPVEAGDGSLSSRACEIYRACRRMMDRADAILANLTPFRSVSADVGTVFELGHFAGAGKPLFAYTNVPDDLLTRLRTSGQSLTSDPARGWLDETLSAVEDFGNADNLMLDMALLEAAAPLVRPLLPVADPARDLAAFERCLALAADRLGRGPEHR